MKKKNENTTKGIVKMSYQEEGVFEFSQDIELSYPVEDNTEIIDLLDLFNCFLLKVGFTHEMIESFYNGLVETFVEVDEETKKETYYSRVIKPVEDKFNELNKKTSLLKNNDSKEKLSLLDDDQWFTNILYKINNDKIFAKKVINIYLDYLFSNNVDKKGEKEYDKW